MLTKFIGIVTIFTTLQNWVIYYKDCIRFTLFENEITGKDFRSSLKHEELKERYRGFVVIRPTTPNILGRNIISPKAFKDNNIKICSVKFSSTANSNKFDVRGFPHSSQDSETISCAETSIWGIMEYFGTKYPEYKPELDRDFREEIGLC